MDIDDEDDASSIDDLFPFALAERELIEQLGATVRDRLRSVEPETLRSVAAFLYALERLPYTTPDVALDLAIMARIDGNLAYVSVELDSDRFRLSTGGHIHSPDVGGDSFSKTTFEIEAGGHRQGSTWEFGDWLEQFVCAPGTIEIQGYDDAELLEPAPDDGWDRLARYWDTNSAEDWG